MPLIHCGYTGDVTALCCLDLDTGENEKKAYLFAGLGSQLHVYPLLKGLCQQTSVTVFQDGTKIHCIHGSPADQGALLAVCGGRIAKVLLYKPGVEPIIINLCRLGPFPQWTLDTNIKWISSTEALCTVGLSNNSIAVFSVRIDDCGTEVQCVCTVECQEKLLLYSLSLLEKAQGTSSVDIWVAAGTVFRDVLVWRVVVDAFKNSYNLSKAPDRPVPLYCLKGHEGSIHRVQWAPDGRTLASASDDRTARLWSLPAESPHASPGPSLLTATRVLYGHEARLWDVQFWGDLVISASEDCTCRIWREGQCLAILQGHRGRGVWGTALLPHHQLATAGADGSIKIWSLRDHLPTKCLPWGALAAADSVCGEGKENCTSGMYFESFALQHNTIPVEPAQPGQGCPHEQQKIKSGKGDWVRSMALAGHGVLYLGTNAGRLQRVHLPDLGSRQERWEHLWDNERAEPLLGLAVHQQPTPDLSPGVVSNKLALRTLVVAGEQSGWASLLALSSSSSEGPDVVCVSWRAHGGRPVLNGFWLSALGPGVVTTVSLDGGLCVWSVSGLMAIHGTAQGHDTEQHLQEHALLAEAMSPLGVRILSLDVDLARQLMVCGDRTGNVFAFFFDASCLERPGEAMQMPLIAVLKHAHQKLPVSLVSIRAERPVRTSSHEGNIHHYVFQPPASPSSTDRHLHSRFGSACRQVISVSSASEEGASQGQHVKVETEAADEQQPKAMQGFNMNAATGNDDQAGQPSAASEMDALLLMNVERISALTMVDTDEDLQGPSGRPERILSGFQADDWIVYSMTNHCELARVRCGGWRRQYTSLLTSPTAFTFVYYRDRKIHIQRRHPPSDKAIPSGEGGNGSAFTGVRSLNMLHHGREIQCIALMPATNVQQCLGIISGGEDGFVQRMLYSTARDPQGLHGCVELGEHAAGTAVKALSLVERGPGCCLMISGGAKEVLMAWQLTWRSSAASAPRAPLQQQQANDEWYLEHRWLSTRPPPKGGLRPRSTAKGCNSRESEHRYMAVAAFAREGCAGDIHIVAASSDATLQHLRFELQTSRWEPVASLSYSTTPVLSLAHVELPLRECHLVFSGATNGAVAVWDCTQQADDIAEQQPLLALPGVHQSGINAMSAACTQCFSGECCVVLATGGDDQSLRVMQIRVRWPTATSKPRLSVLAHAHLPNAHSSALKGVWTDGALIASVGLDQRLRTWTVIPKSAATSTNDGNQAAVSMQHRESNGWSAVSLAAGTDGTVQGFATELDGSFAEVSGTLHGCQIVVKERDSNVLQVLEPSALQVSPAPQGGRYIVVVGRGTQIVHCSDHPG